MSSSNSFVKDKKKLSPKKLWKLLASKFRSKVLNRKSQLSLSKSTPNFLSTTTFSRKHHHHHHYQTINNHHHHYHYYPRPNGNQNLPEISLETSLPLDNKPCDKSSSEDASTLSMENEIVRPKIDDKKTGNSLSMEPEVPQKIGGKGKHVRTITPEIEFFDDYDDDDDEGPEITRSDSKYITMSRVQLFGVDARAEEFINQRKEIWRLEKQKSEKEFWDMLARSV